MMFAGGYFGKLLRVNLTTGRINDEDLDPQTARDYLGGAGLGTKLFFDEVDPRADPLGPENKLLFLTGPLTGTGYPTSGSFSVCTKSPLTNIWLDASATGFWGAEIKKTGYDGLIVQGAASKPVYLWINNDRAEIRDAGHLWGQDTVEVQGAIREELRERRARVACIGPAGEKQVLLATIMNDGGRPAVRGGAGAVMGAKNLKAIAVRGSKSVPVASDTKWREHTRAATRAAAALGMGPLGRYGTAAAMDTAWVRGDMPVQNWRRGIWKEGSISLGGKKMADTILEPYEACLDCPIKCSRWINIEGGQFEMEGAGPEYEALAMFGTNCLNDNLEAVCAANDICNRYGLDAISAGSAVAFAMEAYEKGLLTKADTGGIGLSWGDVDALLEMTKQMGEARGLGKLLGKGVKRAAAEVGRGSEAYAVHVKGLEVPPRDPRAYFSMAVTYATSPIGASHRHGYAMWFEMGTLLAQAGIFRRQGRFDRGGKGLAAKVGQDMASVLNSLVICQHAGQARQPGQIATTLSLITGIPYTGPEVFRAGERIVNLQRLISLRAGLDPAEDTLPPRLMEPTAEGGQAGRVPFLAEGIAEYYQLRGWTADGRPIAGKLKELGLELARERL